MGVCPCFHELITGDGWVGVHGDVVFLYLLMCQYDIFILISGIFNSVTTCLFQDMFDSLACTCLYIMLYIHDVF